MTPLQSAFKCYCTSVRPIPSWWNTAR